MPRIAMLAPFAVAALIAGCGSSSTTTNAPKTATPAATKTPVSTAGGQVSLSETEFKITPASAAVSKTGTITITVHNTGKVTHALAVQTPSGLVRTSAIAPGASATLKVNASKAGSYTFFCPIDHHRMLGMQGTLVVGGSGAASGGAAAAPTTTTSSSSSASGYSY